MQIAPCSKNIEGYFNEGVKPGASGHQTDFYLSVKDTRLRWIKKNFDEKKPELAQIEAAMASMYYLLGRPGSIPEVYSLHRTELFALDHFEVSEVETLKKCIPNDFKSAEAGLRDLFRKIKSIELYHQDYKKKNFSLEEVELLHVFLDENHHENLGKKLLKHEIAFPLSASMSAEFPDFIDLKKFLEKGCSEEKIKFLVDNGFPELCALSYFFEEDDLHKGNIGISNGKVVRVDFDMSAFSIVGRPELRGPRSSVDFRRLEDTFAVSSKDIEQFPELTGADPYYFPGIFHSVSSANGYTVDEVKKINALKGDRHFVRRAYLMFLKMVLMPDALFEGLFNGYIGEKRLASEFSEHFIARKRILKDLFLEKNELPKFKNFLETLSREEIGSIFSDMERYNLSSQARFQQVDLNVARSHFYHFIFDSMKVGDLSRFLNLTTTLAEKFSEDKEMKCKQLKEAHAALLKFYEWLTEKELLALQDIELFVKEMKLNLDRVKNLFVLPDEQVDALYTNITQRLNRLEKNAQAAESLKFDCTSPAEEFDVIEFPVCSEQLNQEKLVINVIHWICQEDKKSVFVGILEQMLSEIKERQNALWSRVSSVVTSATMCASSFFRKSSSPVLSEEIQLQELLADSAKHHQIQLLLTKDYAVELKNQIIFKVITQFVREFSVKKVVEQMQIDPLLAGFLSVNAFFAYPSAGASQLIALFKSEMESLLSSTLEEEGETCAAVASQAT